MQHNPLKPAGQARFDVYVLEALAKRGLPDSPLAASLAFVEPAHTPTGRIFLPTLTLGSLVALRQGGLCTHLGMLTRVEPHAGGPTGEVDLWPLAEAVAVRLSSQPSRRLGLRPMRHLFRAATEALAFQVQLSHLPRQAAEELCAQLALLAPAAIQHIYWTEDDLAQCQADAAAQQRFEELAGALIQSL